MAVRHTVNTRQNNKASESKGGKLDVMSLFSHSNWSVGRLFYYCITRQGCINPSRACSVCSRVLDITPHVMRVCRLTRERIWSSVQNCGYHGQLRVGRQGWGEYTSQDCPVFGSCSRMISFSFMQLRFLLFAISEALWTYYWLVLSYLFHLK